MTLQFAAYSTPTTGAPGYCWIWQDKALSNALLANCIHKLQPFLPRDGRDVLKSVAAGMLSLDNHAAFYNILDGGRDARGRPGRVFVLVAFTAKKYIAGQNMASVFELPAMNEPSEEPIEAISATPVATVREALHIETFEKTGSIQFEGAAAVKEAFNLVGQLISGANCNIRISGTWATPNVELHALCRKAPRPSPALGLKSQSAPDKPGYGRAHILVALVVGFAIGGILGFTVAKVNRPQQQQRPGPPNFDPPELRPQEPRPLEHEDTDQSSDNLLKGSSSLSGEDAEPIRSNKRRMENAQER